MKKYVFSSSKPTQITSANAYQPHDLKSLPEIVGILSSANKTVSGEQLPVSGWESALIGLMESDDVCALARFKPLDHQPISALTPFLLRAPDLVEHSADEDQVFLSLLMGSAANHARDAAYQFSGSNQALVFYNALLQGNLFHGLKNESPDFQLSIRLFEWLKNSDPSNGAYSYFLASVKDRAGYSIHDVREELKAALQAKTFKTPTRELVLRLYEKGLKNPSSDILATHIIAKLPTADYLPSNSLIQNALNDGELSFAVDAVSFGRTMMREGNQYGGLREIVYWNAVEYSVGYGTFKRAWGQVHPGESMPTEAFENYQKFFRDNLQFQASVALWERVIHDARYCPREEIDDEHLRAMETHLVLKKAAESEK